MKPLEEKLLGDEEIDWLAEFEEFLTKYCQAQRSNVEVAIYDTRPETLSEIKEHYKLTKSKARELIRNVKNNETTFCDKNNDTINFKKDILFIPVDSNYYGETSILIAIKGKNNILENEQFLVLNLIKLFETHVFNTLKRIELEQPVTGN